MNSNEDGELKNFIKVWSLALTSLTYCYFISSKLPKGLTRLVSLLPIITLFTFLPFNLHSIHLGGFTSFFLTWLLNFKLILFAFDQGPLFSSKSNLLHFLLLSSLPIKLKSHNPSSPSQSQSQSKSKTNPILFISKVTLFVLLFQVYEYRHQLSHILVLSLYCVHTYLELELLLLLLATPLKWYGFEIEPQFNEPYLSTSIQDFWGKRWNLMVTGVLKPSVYYPICGISTALLGKNGGQLLGVVGVFVVSGLMHEFHYYHLTRVSPTWEVTWFFVVNGVSVCVEIVVKRVMVGRWQMNRVVSGVLSLGFVVVTGFWLFFPQLLRNNVDHKALDEIGMVVDFVKRIVKHGGFLLGGNIRLCRIL